MDSDDNATFQQSKSEFVEVVKHEIKELVQHIANLEDTLYMKPDLEVEKRVGRIPYSSFRRVFRELFLMTRNTAKNEMAIQAVDYWLKNTPYLAETKREDFLDGIGLAELWIEEMYKVGLLDMNVSEPVDYPFQDVIEDMTEEYNRQRAIQQNINYAGISDTKVSENDPIVAANLSYSGDASSEKPYDEFEHRTDNLDGIVSEEEDIPEPDFSRDE